MTKKKYLAKPGKHGTLHAYAIDYRCGADSGSPTFTWRTWAYDVAHAIEKFMAGDDGDWDIVGEPRRILERV